MSLTAFAKMLRIGVDVGGESIWNDTVHIQPLSFEPPLHIPLTRYSCHRYEHRRRTHRRLPFIPSLAHPWSPCPPQSTHNPRCFFRHRSRCPSCSAGRQCHSLNHILRQHRDNGVRKRCPRSGRSEAGEGSGAKIMWTVYQAVSPVCRFPASVESVD